MVRRLAWRDRPTRRFAVHALVRAANRPMRLIQEELSTHLAWRDAGTQDSAHAPMRGWLAVPLCASDGRNVGLIQLSDRYQSDFDEADEAVLMQLAELDTAQVEAVGSTTGKPSSGAVLRG